MACQVLIRVVDPTVKDKDGKTAADCASTSKYEEIRAIFEHLQFFLGQYELQSVRPVHKSATCLVLFAKCLVSNKLVALKCFSKEHRRQAEIGIRSRLEQNLDGIVVGLVGTSWHSPDSAPLVVCMGTSIWSYHRTGKTYDKRLHHAAHPWLPEYPYVMVLERGAMSAHEYGLLGLG